MTASQMIPPDRDVKLLLQRHQAELNNLKASLKDVLGDPKFDDIFLLRYILSWDGDSAKAEKAVRSTLLWRQEKASLLNAAKEGTPPPQYAVFHKTLAIGIHGTTNSGDVILVARAGISDFKDILDDNPQLNLDDVVDYMMFCREQVYLQCDATTRETGRLCKAVTVTDLNHASLKKMHKKFTTVLTAVSKLSEAYYPQFLDTAIMMNLPIVMKTVMKMVMGVMPKKTQEKLRVCPGRTLKEDISKCPFARAHLKTESVPTFLGGRCQCKHIGGCVHGIPNDSKKFNLEVDDDGMSDWTVASKGKYEVFLNVDVGSTVSYAFQVEKKALASGAVEVEARLRNENGDLVVLKAEKYKPDQGLIRGEITCPEAGNCIFSFSNGSLMSRPIRYSVAAIGVHGELGGEDGHKEAAYS